VEIFRSLGTYDRDITHSLETYVEMIPRLGSLRGQYSVRGDDFRFSRPIHGLENLFAPRKGQRVVFCKESKFLTS
jgi:hypothetical protein